MALAGVPCGAQTGVMMHASKRLTEMAGVFAVLYAARRYYRNWGTSKGECHARMPGDELVGDPVVQVTEAIWVDSPPSVIWPHLLRIGQDRGSRNGYQELESSAGLRMRADDGRDPTWEQLTVGETLRLKPRGWMGLRDGLSLRIDAITPERSIVLRATSPNLPDTMWSFHLEPHWATHTRLLARARIGLRRPGEIVAIELARPVIALAMRKVLLDIKRLVQRQVNEVATVVFAY